jgi:uncharacterized protein
MIAFSKFDRLAVVVAAFLGLALASAAGVPASESGTLAVSATGVAYGVPDVASLDVGFSTVAEDVPGALADADAVIVAIRAALLAHGVAERDVRTSTFAVWGEQRWDDNGGPVTVGYRVTHQLNVTVRDVEAVGAVLAATVAAGANQIGGIHFAVDDRRALESEARRGAFEAARAKAQELAGLAGLTLGDVISIVEVPLGGLIGIPEGMGGAARDMASPVATGQLGVEVRLDIRFRLGP